jgi:methionine-gamma-lyase
VPVLIDSTFATPVLQNPLRHGVALVLHSATKFLGGHGDVLAGVVACADPEDAAALRRVRVAPGAVLHPLGAYLLLRGLPTLPLRVRAAQANAVALAPQLAAHPAVGRVLYPGLPDGDPAGLGGRQMKGPGTLLAIELTGGLPAARAFLGALRLATHAVSLGSTDTLVQHPASLTHRAVDPAARAACGIDDGLVRISCGIEDPADLAADLLGALDQALLAEHIAPALARA